MSGILGLPPGLRGFVAAEQAANDRGMNQLRQIQGVLGMQNAMEERAMQAQLMPLKMQLLKAQAAKASAPAQRNPLSVSGGALIPDDKSPDGYRFMPTATPKAPEESTLGRLSRERDALPANDPRRGLYDQYISKLTTHAPASVTNVVNRQESEFGKAVGKEMGEMYSGLLKADLAAPGTISKYNRLGSLLSDVNTGKFKGTITDLKAATKSLGIDLNSLGIGDDVAPAQAARALSNQLALELRNPAGGAGMPGAMSDKDREFLLQSIPGLENDPGAISKMIEYRVKLAQREQKVARMARDYRRKNGRFDEGFFDELSKWSANNPLFPTTVAPVGRLNPAEQAELNALRKRFGK